MKSARSLEARHRAGPCTCPWGRKPFPPGTAKAGVWPQVQEENSMMAHASTEFQARVKKTEGHTCDYTEKYQKAIK